MTNLSICPKGVVTFSLGERPKKRDPVIIIRDGKSRDEQTSDWLTTIPATCDQTFSLAKS